MATKSDYWENEERVAELRRLWAEGHSASIIAGRLGGITRMAVIGKARRLKLAHRKTTQRFSAAQAAANARRDRRGGTLKGTTVPKLRELHAKMKVAVPVIPAVPLPALVIDEPVSGNRIDVLDLKDHMCRWPIGDPLAPDFHFCGAQKVHGVSYCEAHAARAFIGYRPANVTARQRAA